MAPRLRILLVASEASPFAKTGGLADVAGALPRALAALGHDVRILMPQYRGVERHAPEIVDWWCRGVARAARRPRGRRARSSRAATPVRRARVLPRPGPLLRPRGALRHRATATTGTTASASSSSAAAALEARGAPRREAAGTAGARRSSTPTTGRPGLVPVYLRTLYRDHPDAGEASPPSSPSTTSPTRACSGTTTCR